MRVNGLVAPRVVIAFSAAVALSLGGLFLAFSSGHLVWGWLLAPLICAAIDYVGFAQRSGFWLLAGIGGNIAVWAGVVYAILTGIGPWRERSTNSAA